MGGCVTKENETQHKDPVIVLKKPRKIPSLSSIEENHLYKVRIEKERREAEQNKETRKLTARTEWCFN